MNKLRIIKTDEELKIFSDPYRLRIISTYKENNQPLTAKGVADLMGEVPAKVHYHVKKLLSINILELDHIEIIKGIQAKYYKLTTDNFKIDYSNTQRRTTDFINSTELLINNIIEEFKNDVHVSSNTFKTEGKESFDKKGIFSKDNIYLSTEDYKTFEKEITNLFHKYGEISSDKKKFSFFAGLIEKN
jgi:DNA-binding transcriptional regulator GbsR (MarR family)